MVFILEWFCELQQEAMPCTEMLPSNHEPVLFRVYGLFVRGRGHQTWRIPSQGCL